MPIIDLCLEVERIPRPRVSKWWWENDGVDVEGMWTATQEAERIEGEGDTDEADTGKE